jgi:hypothetical protein
VLVVIIPLSVLLSPCFCSHCRFLFAAQPGLFVPHQAHPAAGCVRHRLGICAQGGSWVVLIEVARFSPWLYVVTTLGSLYLGFGKRRAELALLADGANAHRRVLDGYTLPLLDQLITIVSSTTIVAYSLYTFSAPNLPENHIMMLTIPFVIYGIFRYLYLIQVKHSGGAPEDVLLSDRPLQASIILWGISVLIVFYVV